MGKIVLIRLSGEVFLKSPAVVRRWVDILMENIRMRLRRKNIGFYSVDYVRGRIIVRGGSAEDIAFEVSRVFGVREAVVCLEVPTQIDGICSAAVELARNWAGTFAVRTNRVYKGFPLTSLEVNKVVGRRILEANDRLRVDLSNPDNTLVIEIRENSTFIYEKRINGPRGLPYGVSGSGVALMSGGIDSTLAAWLMMKRGMQIISLHLDLSPFYSAEAKDRFMDAIRWLGDWVPDGKIKTYIVPIGEIHSKVELPGQKYRCVFCKMLMLKIAETVARIEKAQAIITGEVLSQVASQTPENMKTISSVVGTPILRPLISMDKDEIDDMARKIGLYSIVARDVGKCKLVPEHPATKTKREIAEKVIQILDHIDLEELIERGEIHN